MYDVQHQFASEGLYPVFSTKDSTVKVHNFYPETAELWEQLTAAKVKSKTLKKNELLLLYIVSLLLFLKR